MSSMDLHQPTDWRLMEDLKEKWCTVNEVNDARFSWILIIRRTNVIEQAEMAIQLYDFYVRRPSAPTRKYQLKLYDEVISAPLW